jgi:hypothetical protein
LGLDTAAARLETLGAGSQWIGVGVKAMTAPGDVIRRALGMQTAESIFAEAGQGGVDNNALRLADELTMGGGGGGHAVGLGFLAPGILQAAIRSRRQFEAPAAGGLFGSIGRGQEDAEIALRRARGLPDHPRRGLGLVDDPSAGELLARVGGEIDASDDSRDLIRREGSREHLLRSIRQGIADLPVHLKPPTRGAPGER